MTAVRADDTFSGLYLNNLASTPSGGISGGGQKNGRFRLDSSPLVQCCYSQRWWFGFSSAGYFLGANDSYLNDVYNKYTYTFYPTRFSNAERAFWEWHHGTGYQKGSTIVGNSWTRYLYQTEFTVIAGDSGHVLIHAWMTPDQQGITHPVDFGDGVLISTARTVKYAPNGAIEFSVSTPPPNLGSIIDPLGRFYNIGRTASGLTITKQDGMGAPLWTKTYSMVHATPKWAHAFDTTGNLYLGFNFSGTANLGNGPMTAIGSADFGLAKLDADGNPLWAKHFGTPTFDMQSIQLTPTGAEDLLIRVGFAGTADFGDGPFTGGDILAKFDASGTLVWRTPAPVGSFLMRGAQDGSMVIASTGETTDFGWGPVLGQTEYGALVAAKYGPCADPVTCRSQGAACGSNAQCQSGFCADGVCCESACSGTCEACSAIVKGQGVDGVCQPIKIGQDPDNECADACNGQGQCGLGNGSACINSSDCTFRNCVDGVCCDTACTGICNACTAAKKGSGVNGVCGPIGANSDPDGECGGGSCSGASTCINAPLGIACVNGSDCVSGFCSDGVCCNSACTTKCMACKQSKTQSGPDGQCLPVAVYTDPDNECANGTCAGAGVCHTSVLGDPCMTNWGDCPTYTYCVEGVCCNTACSGLCASCLAAKTGLATNGTCGSIQQGTDPDNECPNGTCSGNFVCQLDTGFSCTNPAQCASGNCVDGFCCDTPCHGDCQVCSSALKGGGLDGVCGSAAAGTDPHDDCVVSCDNTGACMPAPDGSHCSNGLECTSGHCVDGFCCDAACTGACMACSAVKKGIGVDGLCEFIAAGRDAENECPGTCNGAGACAPPPNLLNLGSTCSAGSQCTSGHCIDGLCCNTSCDETCKTCNRPGSEGTCVPHSPNACNTCGNRMMFPIEELVGSAAKAMTLVDLNQDGLLDVAAVSGNAVNVFLGSTNATYELFSENEVDSGPSHIVSGDFNADGAVDLATTNDAKTVSILLNTGDGTFTQAVHYQVNTKPEPLAVADFNGDGNLDIVVGYNPPYQQGVTPPTVGVLLGNGLGAFASVIDTQLVGQHAASLVVTDMTRDGVADVVIASDSTLSGSTLRGTGNGQFVDHDQYPFAQPNSYASGRVAVADVDVDGFMDVAIAADFWNWGEVGIYRNPGTGIFENPTSKTTIQQLPTAIRAADLNGDGAPELIVPGVRQNDGVSIFVNNGVGAFSSSLFRTSATMFDALAADIDGDTDVDLVAPTFSGILPLLNQGNTTFANEITTESRVQLVDLNGDGKLDIFRANGATQLNQGNDTFGAVASVGANSGAAVGDVNGDSRPDLATIDTNLSSVNVRMNNGNGSFGTATTYLTVYQPKQVFVADMTGDNLGDLVTVSPLQWLVSIHANNGNGTFAPRIDYSAGLEPRRVMAADVNGDNLNDLVIGGDVINSDGFNIVKVGYNNGDGTFSFVDRLNGQCGDFMVADLNGDGRLDFAFSSGTGVLVQLNKGGGTFGLSTNFEVGTSNQNGLNAKDMDGDGIVDLVVHSYVFWSSLTATTNVFFGTGSGQFRSPVRYPGWSQTINDFNGDGLMDFVHASTNAAVVKYGGCRN